MGRTTAQMMDIATFSGAGWGIVAVAPGASNTTRIWNIVDHTTYPFLSWQPVRYNLTISSTAGGNVTRPGEGPFMFARTAVRLVATPDAGFGFVNWTGNVTTIANVTAANTTIHMDGNYSIMANFVAVYHLTMAAAPAGGGTATDLTGTSPYPAGTVVSITAVANPGFRFVNWTAPAGTFGDATLATTTFTMPAANVTVTANFEFMFAGGDGSAANPFQITNWHHLNNVRHHLGANFTLMNDLNNTTPGYTEWASSTAHNGTGWLPIGTDAARFTGNFTGGGREIRDLFINRATTDRIGLFGVVGSGGVVRNVGVVSANVTGRNIVGGLVGDNRGTITISSATGNVTGTGDVGGLVGDNWGTVSNSSATGSVTGTTHVGGLVGWNNGTVTNSYSTGRVTGTSGVGGLVGWNNGTISNSYSTGRVTGTGDVGGLVGMNWGGTITNSYSTGRVTGTEDVGGLVGDNRGTITNSYAAGRVTGTTNVGGLIGLSATVAAVTASFWDIETSGQPTSAGGAGAMGRTTAQMMDIATFSGAGWGIVAVAPGASNTTRIWNIVDHTTYPFLSWQPVRYNLTISSTAGGNVTRPGEGPFMFARTAVRLVATPDAGFGFVNWTGNVTTIANVTAANTTIRMDGNYSIMANFVAVVPVYHLTMAVAPAGAGNTTPSIGTHTFTTGTVVNITATPATGFRFVNWTATPAVTFGNATAPTTTFTMPAANVTVTANFAITPFAGGDGTAASPYRIANWHHLNNVRHHLGSHFILISDLHAGTAGYAEWAGSGAHGGLGWLPIGTAALPFTGNFTGNFTIRDLFINRTAQNNVGLFGFVGHGGVIQNVGLVSATVTGRNSVGGLVGNNQGTVTRSYVTGNVTGRNNVGGLVGTGGPHSTVTRSFYATGKVTGRSSVGGLVGANRGTVSDSYSTGRVTGRNNVGGLVGANRGPGGTVTRSYATGNVTGRSSVGGLVGANRGAVTASFWDTVTSGQATSAGGTGKTTAEMRNIATFTGWDIVAVATGARNPAFIWNIVGGVDYPFLSWQP
jgi:hypothetical protein